MYEQGPKRSDQSGKQASAGPTSGTTVGVEPFQTRIQSGSAVQREPSCEGSSLTSPQPVPERQAGRIRSAAECLCTGVGQIMFGDKPITGAIFLGGLALASPTMAAGTAVGSCIGSLSALAMRCDRTEVKQGLYGFNAALVGLATTVTFSPSLASCALMIGGCVASTAITSAMRKASVSHFTAPFVGSTWATWAIGKALELNPSQMVTSLLPNVSADPFGVLHGIGQVLFQESAVVGLIFVFGLFLSSRKAAVAGLLGAGVGGAVAAATGFSGASIASGLLGYNAALCAIALKDRPAYAALASFVTLPMCAVFAYIGAPALTAPFVVATWLVSSLMGKNTDKLTS